MEENKTFPEDSCNDLEGMRSCLEPEKDHFEAVILPIGRGGQRSARYSKRAAQGILALGDFPLMTCKVVQLSPPPLFPIYPRVVYLVDLKWNLKGLMVSNNIDFVLY